MILFVHVFFMKIWKNRFFITVVYVDYVNIFGALEELPKAIDWLKK